MAGEGRLSEVRVWGDATWAGSEKSTGEAREPRPEEAARPEEMARLEETAVFGRRLPGGGL